MTAETQVEFVGNLSFVSLHILHFGHDTSLAKALQAYAPRTVSGMQVFPATSYDKFSELIEKQHFDAILVESYFDKTLPENWISLLQTKHRTLVEPSKTHFIFLTSISDEQMVRKSLARGYTDVISAPVDLSILLQKLQLFLRNKRFLKENLLFAMDVKEECEISISGHIMKAAEYGATILTDREFPPDQVITVFSQMSADDETASPLLARVVVSNKAPSPNSYLVVVVFLGSTKKDLTNIRVWLRKHYVSSSSAAGGV